jgi:hypothetical protein
MVIVLKAFESMLDSFLPILQLELRDLLRTTLESEKDRQKLNAAYDEVGHS